MARDRRLPGMAASVSKRYGTPSGAIFLLIFIQALLIVASEWWDALFALEGLPHYFSLFVWCSTFGAFALIVVYFLLSIGGLVGLKDAKGRVGVIVASLVGIAITGAAIFGSFYKVPSPTILAPWYALIWGAIGLILMFAVKGREPASDALADLRTSA